MKVGTPLIALGVLDSVIESHFPVQKVIHQNVEINEVITIFLNIQYLKSSQILWCYKDSRMFFFYPFIINNLNKFIKKTINMALVLML